MYMKFLNYTQNDKTFFQNLTLFVEITFFTSRVA